MEVRLEKKIIDCKLIQEVTKRQANDDDDDDDDDTGDTGSLAIVKNVDGETKL